jgi:cell division protein ZapA
MKQLEVQIMGQSYLLGAPAGGEQQLLTAVEKVDTAMCRIRDAGKVKARDRIAVLAALNLAFETDRPAAATPAAATPAAAAPAPSAVMAGLANPGDAASDNTGNDPRLALLIYKLDQALSGDGQLL